MALGLDKAMLTITQHSHAGKDVLIGVQKTRQYSEFVVSICANRPGATEEHYMVTDDFAGRGGYIFVKFGTHETYRTYINWGTGKASCCSCPDARFRRRVCKHMLMAEETWKRW